MIAINITKYSEYLDKISGAQRLKGNNVNLKEKKLILKTRLTLE